MDYGNPPLKLKAKYTLFTLGVVLSCITIAGYPIWLAAEWLSAALGIVDNTPVKEQDNGLLWFLSFTSGAIVIFIVCYFALSLIISKSLGWTKEKYINIFWKSKYPSHWRRV
jgi:hypothetical protein